MNSYRVCVIGVGELGTRIAGELSLYGIKVNVFDSDSSKLKNVHQMLLQQKEELARQGLIGTVSYEDVDIFSNLAEAVNDVDFIFEAIIDNLEVKQWLYESTKNK